MYYMSIIGFGLGTLCGAIGYAKRFDLLRVGLKVIRKTEGYLKQGQDFILGENKYTEIRVKTGYDDSDDEIHIKLSEGKITPLGQSTSSLVFLDNDDIFFENEEIEDIEEIQRAVILTATQYGININTHDDNNNGEFVLPLSKMVSYYENNCDNQIIEGVFFDINILSEEIRNQGKIILTDNIDTYILRI